MDFTVIERHPWATTVVVGLGGLGLYLLLRRGSSGSSGADAGGGVVYAGNAGPTDAQIAANAAITQTQIAANAKTSELSAQLAAIGIQSNATVKIAELGAGVQNYQTAAALQSDLFKTSAQLTYGLSTQQTQVDLARINAGVQQSYIDKMYSPAAVATQTAINRTQPSADPIYTSYLPQVTQVQTPAVNYPYVKMGDPVVQYTNDQTPLVPKPSYAVCAPTDSACVARNQQTDAAYWANVIESQANNTYNRCIQDGNSAATCAANKAAFRL